MPAVAGMLIVRVTTLVVVVVVSISVAVAAGIAVYLRVSRAFLLVNHSPAPDAAQAVNVNLRNPLWVQRGKQPSVQCSGCNPVFAV
jgi:hypothetical protein